MPCLSCLETLNEWIGLRQYVASQTPPFFNLRTNQLNISLRQNTEYDRTGSYPKLCAKLLKKER
jgi:hypothetical protein